MYMRYLGCVLLVWLPGMLHAQKRADQPCHAPRLRHGYFVPEEEMFSHDAKLTYACYQGYKPAVEGWWATSTCQDGTWSHEPNCIDEKACTAPDIPNAEYTGNTAGWYEEGESISVKCTEGYKARYRDDTATCLNGTWLSPPVCEKNACGEPPNFPHAVIIHQEYQEFFAAGSVVQYECEDGYTVERADTKKFIFCLAGNWTEGPTCMKSSAKPTMCYLPIIMADEPDQVLDLVVLRWGEQVVDKVHLLAVGHNLQTEEPDQVLDLVVLQWGEQVVDKLHLLAAGHNLQTEEPDQVLDLVVLQWGEQVVDKVLLLAVGHNLQVEVY
ncbi:complement factor H-related protein 2-like [Pempheris klunzingeri]|uniref:complement factor H-related protein 2-like n=1 Tax=Pempheris klunzingeri TaxID=3127111 RepID=UPI00397EB371